MNIYIVREQDMERVEVFTSRKRAVRHLYFWGYHPKVETDMFELWGRDYNQPERGFFRAYLEEKKLVGAEHNYKYECKQLRATVRYLHRKIDMLQRRLARYRHRVTALKEENERLRDKLARYRELELAPNGGK